MTKILGRPVATAYQMSQYLLSVNKNPKFTRNVSAAQFCQLFLDVCAKEGVRGDLAFAQACKETGNFTFKSEVKYSQNNFAGIGATGGVTGCVFPDIETGILAQAQHLKTYATKDSLNCPNVDPRRTKWFINTKGGTSPDIEGLGGTWAVPGYSTSKYRSLTEANNAKDSYGYQIIAILNNILKIKNVEEQSMNNKPIIAIDAGHGLKTSGKRCLKSLDPNETREWWLNDRIADRLENLLASYNCRVVRVDNTTGTTDVSLANRVKTANNANATVYISIHHNAGLYGKKGGGTVLYYYSSNAQDIRRANDLYNAVVKETGLVGNRSTKVGKSAFYVLKNTKMSAYLLENGFMDSPQDVPQILSAAHAEKTARGILNFLVKEYNLQKNGNVIVDKVVAPAPVAPTYETYTVQKGDTLSKIGVKTGIAWTTIASLNGIKFPYVVRVGQILKLKETTKPTPTPSNTNKKFVKDGLDFSCVFDPVYYANKYPDLKTAFGTDATKLFNHFIQHGISENRQASASFNIAVYKNNNADLQKAFGNDTYAYVVHYCQYGKNERRVCK